MSLRTIKLPAAGPPHSHRRVAVRHDVAPPPGRRLGVSRDTLWWWLRGVVKPHHDIDGRLIDLHAERDAVTERGMEITAVRKRLMSRRMEATS